MFWLGVFKKRRPCLRSLDWYNALMKIFDGFIIRSQTCICYSDEDYEDYLLALLNNDIQYKSATQGTPPTCSCCRAHKLCFMRSIKKTHIVRFSVK